MLYRLYFEHVNEEYNRVLQNRGIDGYTVFFGVGVWKGQTEDTVVVEIADETELGTLAQKDSEARIRAVAEDIRAELGQEAVLVVAIPASINIVETLAPGNVVSIAEGRVAQ